MPNRRRQNSREIYGVALIALAMLVSLSVFEAAGLFGVYILIGLKWLFGAGRYLLPLFLLLLGGLFFTKDPEEVLQKTSIGFMLLLASFTVGVHLGVPSENNFAPDYIWNYGGLIGAAFVSVLKPLIGVLGSYIVVVAGGISSVIFLTGVSIREIAVGVGARRKQRPKKRAIKKEPKTAGMRPVVGESTAIAEDTVEIVKPVSKAKAKKNSRDNTETAEVQFELIDDQPLPGDGYELPPVALLKKSPPARAQAANDKEQIAVLERTLKDFDIGAKVDCIVKGPTVTRFEMQIASGVKVNRIVSLADDIALALASADIRVLAPIPGRSAVGIEVPNADRQLVTLGDVLGDVTRRHGGPLLTAVGKDISGKSVLSDISEMPHLLIAGATGSGKSVCVNGILMTLLLRAHPSEVKLVLIDPKRVELNLYNDIPHLLVPVVTGPKEAARVLSWAVGEMDARYQLLAEAHVRNISSYNQLVKEEFADREPLPFIVVVIDELADLMMVAAGDVEDAICRLAQMARAVGIHLVVATQRPSANIITGMIKANITCRIAFAVSSQVDSRVVLDANGAEKLVGKGDMLFQSSDSPKARRLQGPYVSEKEVEAVVGYIKKQAKPEYKREILSETKEKPKVEFTDELFDEALELVVSTGQASTSSLQRRLRVGYARAARLIDMLEQRGLIGPADGAKPRDILITREELEELRGAAEIGT